LENFLSPETATRNWGELKTRQPWGRGGNIFHNHHREGNLGKGGMKKICWRAGKGGKNSKPPPVYLGEKLNHRSVTVDGPKKEGKKGIEGKRKPGNPKSVVLGTGPR